MKRFILLFIYVVILVACTPFQEPLPTLMPVAQVAATETATATVTVTPTPTGVIVTPTLTHMPSTSTALARQLTGTPTLFPTQTPSPTPSLPDGPSPTPVPTFTHTPWPTRIPEDTATPPPPTPPPPAGFPFTDGMIAILWSPTRNEYPQIVTYQLDFAIPGATPDEWVIQTALTGLTSYAMFPSPDGQKLALAQYQDTNSDGYIPSPAGLDGYEPYLYTLQDGILTKLTNDPVFYNPEVAWLPDSEGFTYLSRKDIFLANLENNSPPQPLLSFSGSLQEHKWSPDGQWLAVFSFLSDEPMSGSENARLDLFNSDTHELVSIVEGVGAGDLMWSPRSQWLAYTYDTRQGLFILNPDNLESKELISLDYHTFASWTPNGQWLSIDNRANSTIQLWDADSEMIMELIPGAGRPIWSPDSSEFVLHLYDVEQARLIITDRETLNSRELFAVDRVDYSLREDNEVQFVPELQMLGWSPDGQWLLFFADQGDQVGLFIINRIGGKAYMILSTGLYGFYSIEEHSPNVMWLPTMLP